MNRIPIGRKLYLSVLIVFMVYTVSFMVFQQLREKQYKIDLLNVQLQGYNKHLHDYLNFNGQMSERLLNDYMRRDTIGHLRVTLIARDGRVIFDSARKDYAHMANHARRTEFVEALRKGQGAVVERNSNTMKRDYFYSATYYPRDGYVIRSALPYDNSLSRALRADQHFLWFSLVAIVLLTLVLYRFTSRLGSNIAKLRVFAWRADHNASLEVEDLAEFPDDELGEIAERIIKLYKTLQDTRREQDTLKRQLTQNVAHELKTPVASIQGYLETILSNPDMDRETKMQFLSRCYAQSERLTSLLRDISTLNRMDDAPQMKDFERVDIARLVDDIGQELALQIKQKNMTWVDLLPPSLIVDGNKGLLYSVFRNLMDNALAYAGDGVTMTLKAEREGNQWHFSFMDNGVGVPHEHLGRLFERFYRVDKGRSRKMGGTGLGLAIVKNAVKLHGGTIKASNNPTGGLRLDFTLNACSH